MRGTGCWDTPPTATSTASITATPPRWGREPYATPAYGGGPVPIGREPARAARPFPARPVGPVRRRHVLQALVPVPQRGQYFEVPRAATVTTAMPALAARCRIAATTRPRTCPDRRALSSSRVRHYQVGAARTIGRPAGCGRGARRYEGCVRSSTPTVWPALFSPVSWNQSFR